MSTFHPPERLDHVRVRLPDDRVIDRTSATEAAARELRSTREEVSQGVG